MNRSIAPVLSLRSIIQQTLSTTETALTTHLVMPGGFPGDAFLVRVSQDLHDQFSIEHATVQIETGDANFPCPLAQDNFV